MTNFGGKKPSAEGKWEYSEYKPDTVYINENLLKMMLIQVNIHTSCLTIANYFNCLVIV